MNINYTSPSHMAYYGYRYLRVVAQHIVMQDAERRNNNYFGSLVNQVYRRYL